MSKIHILDEATIDKIAAGEVIERPASIIKELVENSIDAGANIITVEIKEGGISFIRITDNGEGIEKSEIRNAFYRHATSKLNHAEDIETIKSLGFRGEALSSIAAIGQVELITKTKDDLTGVRFVIEGAKEKSFEEIGVPNGTTLIVRNVFFNTPVRRKFLHSAVTEAGYITEVCEHLAMSRPDISFKFVNASQVKFHTSGNGDLKEVIYRIYGRDITQNLIPVLQESKDITIRGFLGKPSVNRANRNYENYFLNGRYIKSKLIAQAVEEGYKSYLMQHKFPMFILNIEVNTSLIDINVHPTKMDVRFSNQTYVYDYLVSAISAGLKVHEMIPDAILEEKDKEEPVQYQKQFCPEPFEEKRIETLQEKDPEYRILPPDFTGQVIHSLHESKTGIIQHPVIKAQEAVVVSNQVQMDLFEDKILSKTASEKYEIIGQIFDTYWLITYEDKLLFMDQHAAHEKVKYEALVKRLKENKCASQALTPPLILSINGQEETILENYHEYFLQMGFEFDSFGGNEIAIRSVPMELYGKNEKEMFIEILDSLSDEDGQKKPEFILEKMASMACKSAVKGNHSMNRTEVIHLIDELLKLDNPYNCPHGRPTLITMSKYEIEKKFKRVL